MRYYHPWEIKIAHFNVKDLIDLDAVRDEIVYLHCLTEGDDRGQSYVTPDFIPHILKMRDELITPRVQQYVKETWDYDMALPINVETSGKWIKEGEGLFPHYHPGSCVSALFYPDDSKSGLAMFDPRGNACRGYPRPIRDKFFRAHGISPVAGEVFIFPSYIQHSVTHVKEDMRLSLLSEYYMAEDL